MNEVKAMLLKTIDRYFQKEPNYSRLNRLESDVWRQIRQSKTIHSAVLFMLPVWDNSRLRYASLTLALVGGLMMSQVSMQPNTHTDTLGLEVFSPNAPFIMTDNFKLTNGSFS